MGNRSRNQSSRYCYLSHGGKKQLILLFFLLQALTCCEKHPWRTSYLKGNTNSRLFYASKDQVQGLDLELIYTDHTLTTYLQTHAPIQAPSFQTTVYLKTKDHTFQANSFVHQGLQRIHLSKELEEKLLFFLENALFVTIEVGDYKETIDTKDFKKNLHKLYKQPLSIPFHLSF